MLIVNKKNDINTAKLTLNCRKWHLFLKIVKKKKKSCIKLYI